MAKTESYMRKYREKKRNQSVNSDDMPSILSDIDNSILFENYNYVQATDKEANALHYYTIGESNRAIRESQQERAALEEKVAGQIERLVSSGKYTREQAEKKAKKVLDRNPINPKASAIEGYISRSPNFEGTLYRGLEQSGWDYQNRLKGLKAGDKVSFDSMTSWSATDSSKFTHTKSGSGEAQKQIKLVTNGSIHNNAAVDAYSPNMEREVLISAKSTFKIAKIVETDSEIRYFLK